MNILLIGHRGTGKTTTARLLSFPHVDLDTEIEHAHGQSCANIIATQGLPAFRAIETRTLTNLLATPCPTPRVIVLGAGCETIPQGVPTIWLSRDGWEVAAQHERARLRPDIPFAQELAWMHETRSPRYAQAAHIHVHVSRGRTPQHVARTLDTWIAWLHQAPQHPWLTRTFTVPATPEELLRAQADHLWLRTAGLELRSDFFLTCPETCAPILASVRHDDPHWLRDAPPTTAIDIDIAHLPGILRANTLNTRAPQTLLLSCHPDTHDTAHLQALQDAAHAIQEKHPDWAPHVYLKYAPGISSWTQLQDALLQTQELRGTFLPQGDAWAWTRPWLMARGNQTNYLPTYSRHATPDRPTPYDLQDWLPHFTSPAPQAFDALIGDPVRQSIGDVWHRRAALKEHRAQGYLKVPLDGDLQVPLATLTHMGILNLSVTSPHKRALVDSGLHNPEGLSAANTATLGKSLTDTDAVGMHATLEHLQSLGLSPGPVAIIGRGGVSPAILRALEDSEWTITLHASAREGWPEHVPEVCAVINAAGDHDGAYQGAPEHKAWVDLHYQGVRQPPVSGVIHLNGDIFFQAQARAQRVFWQHS